MNLISAPINALYAVFGVKKDELKILFYSLFFIFLIFASYAILRPLRDAAGLSGGVRDLKWLFLATFVFMIIASLMAMYLTTRLKRKNYLNFIFIFFALNLLAFYALFVSVESTSSEYLWLSRSFYVWLSVFNVFVISCAWSLLADIFKRDSSQRLFGIISAGASLGGILGASLVGVLVKQIGANNFIFISILFLLLALFFKFLLIKEAQKFLDDAQSKNRFIEKFNAPIGSKNPFEGFKLIAKSRYLMAFLGFILLLTSISTFLYMEQARIIELFFKTREERAQAFAGIDLVVQSLSFFIQIFLTTKIAKAFGLKFLLGALGFVVCGCFLVLFFVHPSFLAIVVAMSIRRVGEYALVKPGREMAYVPLSSDEKYKVKNFLDTVVYRAGDALSSQVESFMASFGVGAALLFGAALSLLWGLVGVKIGRDYEKIKNA